MTEQKSHYMRSMARSAMRDCGRRCVFAWALAGAILLVAAVMWVL